MKKPLAMWLTGAQGDLLASVRNRADFVHLDAMDDFLRIGLKNAEFKDAELETDIPSEPSALEDYLPEIWCDAFCAALHKYQDWSESEEIAEQVLSMMVTNEEHAKFIASIKKGNKNAASKAENE